MPVFPVAETPFVQGSYSVSLVDTSGRSGRASLNGESIQDATTIELEAWRTAVGNASNAAMYAANLNTETSVNRALVTPLDEAESSITVKAVLIFQNNSKRIKRVEIPAPDASMFGSDGRTLNQTNGLVIALINSSLAVFNAGDPAGTYAYVRGGLSERSRKGGIVSTKPTIVEPGVATLPPIAPGT